MLAAVAKFVKSSCRHVIRWTSRSKEVTPPNDHLKENASSIPLPSEQSIDYMPMFGSKETIDVVRSSGGHEGGDPLLLEDLFLGSDPLRDYEILAGTADGAYSIAVGEGVWKSIEANKPISIPDLLQEAY